MSTDMPTGDPGSPPNHDDAQPITTGQAALIEAARMETARIYGRLCKEHRQRPRIDAIDDAIDAGWTNAQIMSGFRVGYDRVRSARKARMREIA